MLSGPSHQDREPAPDDETASEVASSPRLLQDDSTDTNGRHYDPDVHWGGVRTSGPRVASGAITSSFLNDVHVGSHHPALPDDLVAIPIEPAIKVSGNRPSERSNVPEAGEPEEEEDQMPYFDAPTSDLEGQRHGGLASVVETLKRHQRKRKGGYTPLQSRDSVYTKADEQDENVVRIPRPGIHYNTYEQGLRDLQASYRDPRYVPPPTTNVGGYNYYEDDDSVDPYAPPLDRDAIPMKRLKRGTTRLHGRREESAGGSAIHVDVKKEQEARTYLRTHPSLDLLFKEVRIHFHLPRMRWLITYLLSVTPITRRRACIVSYSMSLCTS